MGEFVREDFVIEIAHGRGYLLYCNTVEKLRAVSCPVMVLSVHGNSNAEEEQQETEGDDRKASEWKKYGRSGKEILLR